MKEMLSTTHLSAPHRQTLRLLDRILPGGDIFLVGGTLRDLALGRATNDLDVLVGKLSLTTIRRRLAQHGKVDVVGDRFGVLKFRPRGKDFQIDIALPRKEHARNTGGYRDFSFHSDPTMPIEQDLARRDFTVNAMAYNIRSKALIDPFNAMRDLRTKMLRAVGDPALRFGEDYSRLLRLLRFAVALQFSIEPKTAAAARRLMPRLNAKNKNTFIVPREVLAEQLVKTFLADPVRAFDLYDQYGTWKNLLPEVAAMRGCSQDRTYHAEGDVFVHTRKALSMLSSAAFRTTFLQAKPSALVVFATLFHDVGKPFCKKIIKEGQNRRMHFYGHEVRGAAIAQDVCERLKLASFQGTIHADDCAWLVRHHLIGIEQNVAVMRATTLEKYFSGDRGAALLQLIWADCAASIRKNGKPSMRAFTALRRRLNVLFRPSRGVLHAPAPVVSGHDLIRWFGLQPGPTIGGLLSAIREAQLSGAVTTKRAARTFVRSIIAKQPNNVR